MKKFTELTENERTTIFADHITTELIVERTVLNFENIEIDLSGIDITNDFEVPPIIIDKSHLASILSFAPSNDKGRWIRTMVRTYLEGGRVFYKKVDNNNFIATLTFTK